jgi:CheY-like chemotaxis protein
MVVALGIHRLVPVPKPSPAPQFLVVDDNDEHRFLLVKTLLRHFPHALLHECADEESALALATSPSLTAIITHRSLGLTGVELVRRLRALNATVPIVMVSGIDRTSTALAAGATRFLLYDEWLRVGLVVGELIASGAARSPMQRDFGKKPDGEPSAR